jgi:hypothetical protein
MGPAHHRPKIAKGFDGIDFTKTVAMAKSWPDAIIGSQQAT